MILTLGAFISLFLAMLLFGKKRKLEEDSILGIWFLIIAIHLGLTVLYLYDYSYRWPFLLGLDLPLPLIHGPMLFIYGSYSMAKKPRNSAVLLFHFLPVLLLYVYQLPFFFEDPAEKIAFYHAQERDPGLYSQLIFPLFILSTAVYLTASFITLSIARKDAPLQEHAPSPTRLRWHRFVLIGYGIVFLLFVASIFLPYVLIPDKSFFSDGPAYIGIVALIVFIAYVGIQQTGLFSNVQVVPPMKKSLGLYEKSGLTERKAREIGEKIDSVMKEQRLYSEPALSLSELAKAIDEYPSHVSQTMNRVKGLGFHQLVNDYRIREFKSRIDEVLDNRETILSLAFECGFNSKSSFNAIFKKSEGMTPSQFLAQSAATTST